MSPLIFKSPARLSCSVANMPASLARSRRHDAFLIRASGFLSSIAALHRNTEAGQRQRLGSGSSHGACDLHCSLHGLARLVVATEK